MDYFKISVSVLVGLAIIGAYFFPKAIIPVGSTVGSTFNTAKIAEVVMAPTSITATSTSVLNTDTSDRIVLDAGVSCSGLTTMNGSTGGGVDAFHWYAGTSSVAAPTASIATAQLLAMNITVATSSTEGFTSTTTYTSPFSRRWNAGSYLVFQTNATSSAVSCLPYVHYIGS